MNRPRRLAAYALLATAPPIVLAGLGLPSSEHVHLESGHVLHHSHAALGPHAHAHHATGAGVPCEGHSLLAELDVVEPSPHHEHASHDDHPAQRQHASHHEHEHEHGTVTGAAPAHAPSTRLATSDCAQASSSELPPPGDESHRASEHPSDHPSDHPGKSHPTPPVMWVTLAFALAPLLPVPAAPSVLGRAPPVERPPLPRSAPRPLPFSRGPPV